MLDVIEHLPDPFETLRLCNKILKPGGVILITTGDFDALIARLTGRHWRLMTPPQHLWYFSRTSFSSMADSLALNMVSCTRPWKLVSDGEDVSITELLRRMGRAMSHPARLIPVPTGWLKLAAAMVGKQDVAQRLCGSLQVDIEKTRRLLGWKPPLTLDQGLKKAAQGI